MTFTSNRRVLSRARTLDFLSELGKTCADKTFSIYLPPGISQAELETFLKEMGIKQDILPEITGVITSSGTGAAVFWSPEARYAVLPPFPLPSRPPVAGFASEPLSSLLKTDRRIALVLIRLGSYAIGVCDGENLVSSKVDTGLVHGRHRQGGSSAHRFERHRDKQIEYFLTRVCGHIREQLEPHVKTIDNIVYGGAWTTILSLKKQCLLLQQFEERTLPPLLDIPDPRQAVLEKAVARVWSSTVIEWRQD